MSESAPRRAGPLSHQEERGSSMEPWQVATAMRALHRAKPASGAGTSEKDE